MYDTGEKHLGRAEEDITHDDSDTDLLFVSLAFHRNIYRATFSPASFFHQLLDSPCTKQEFLDGQALCPFLLVTPFG